MLIEKPEIITEIMHITTVTVDDVNETIEYLAKKYNVGIKKYPFLKLYCSDESGVAAFTIHDKLDYKKSAERGVGVYRIESVNPSIRKMCEMSSEEMMNVAEELKAMAKFTDELYERLRYVEYE